MIINKDVFRKDLGDFFKLSGVLNGELKHTPFVVLGQTLDGETHITLCRSAKELVEKYKPETEVICQWVGKFRSDYFLMKVSDVAEAIKLAQSHE